MAPNAQTPPPQRDDRTSIEPGLSPADLYTVIRKAVEDAILSAIGTLLLVGLAAVLIWIGITMAVSASESSLVSAIGGIAVVVFGLYIGASTLGYIPSIAETIRG